MAYLEKSMWEEALTECEREREIFGPGDAISAMFVGIWYARTGERDKALNILNTLLARVEKEHIPSFFIAVLYIELGSVDRGFEWLENAYDSGDVFLSYVQVFSQIDPIRSDPRYTALLRKMGLDRC
jgi:hypothetical protein